MKQADPEAPIEAPKEEQPDETSAEVTQQEEVGVKRERGSNRGRGGFNGRGRGEYRGGEYRGRGGRGEHRGGEYRGGEHRGGEHRGRGGYNQRGRGGQNITEFGNRNENRDPAYTDSFAFKKEAKKDGFEVVEGRKPAPQRGGRGRGKPEAGKAEGRKEIGIRG